jgi:hypothetical protein
MLKTVSSVANALGALNYKGTWNASTNTPTLASGVGTQGDYYVVSVAGTTDLDGITNWGIGDWAAFNGSVWQRVEGGADGNFVNLGYTGTLTGGTGIADIGSGQIYKAASGNVGIGTNSPDSFDQRVNAPHLVVGSGSNSSGLTVYSGPASQGTINFATGTTTTEQYDGGIVYVPGAGSPWMSFHVDAGSEKLRINSTGNIDVTNGNLSFASGSGIDFSATAGTGTSELLSDYEEGTWTPTIVGYTTSGAFTYDVQEGTYTKVGDLVTVASAIYVTATAISPVGDVNIYGLPFTIGNQFPSFTIGWSQFITFADQLGAYGSGTQITLRNMLSGGSGTLVSGADFGSSFYLFISGSYYV